MLDVAIVAGAVLLALVVLTVRLRRRAINPRPGYIEYRLGGGFRNASGPPRIGPAERAPSGLDVRLPGDPGYQEGCPYCGPHPYYDSGPVTPMSRAEAAEDADFLRRRREHRARGECRP